MMKVQCWQGLLQNLVTSRWVGGASTCNEGMQVLQGLQLAATFGHQQTGGADTKLPKLANPDQQPPTILGSSLGLSACLKHI